jgi:hypothetical protein
MMVHNEHSVKLPVLNDDALSLDDEAMTEATLVAGLRDFTDTCVLFDIIGDILSVLYCNNGAVMPSIKKHTQHAPMLSQIMALNGRLEAYLITIPDFLRTFIEGREHANSKNISASTLTIQQAISCRYQITLDATLLDPPTNTCVQILVCEDSSFASGTTHAPG